jgi:hypothetical protein
MAIRTHLNREILFESSRATTALYLAEFQRLFQKTRDEIEKQRQNQFALARTFYEQASRKFQTKPSQTEIAQLLLECMRNHTQLSDTEPAVLTMEIATAITTLASKPAQPPMLSSGTHDFLTEAGILPLRTRPATVQFQPDALPERYAAASQLR